MFTEPLFTVTKNWKQLKCSTTGDMTNCGTPSTLWNPTQEKEKEELYTNTHNMDETQMCVLTVR